MPHHLTATTRRLRSWWTLPKTRHLPLLPLAVVLLTPSAPDAPPAAADEDEDEMAKDEDDEGVSEEGATLFAGGVAPSRAWCARW